MTAAAHHQSSALASNALGIAHAASDALLGMLAPLGQQIALAGGQVLFEQGDPADALYVLVSGRLDITTLSSDGRRLNHILLTDGTVFGEVVLLDEGKRSASATAKTPSKLLQIPRPALLEAMDRDARLSMELAKLTVRRMVWMGEQLGDYAFHPVSARLVRRLLILSETIATGPTILIGREELAEHIGATREAVSKCLASLRAQGIVSLGRGRIVLHDKEALRAAAGIELT